MNRSGTLLTAWRFVAQSGDAPSGGHADRRSRRDTAITVPPKDQQPDQIARAAAPARRIARRHQAPPAARQPARSRRGGQRGGMALGDFPSFFADGHPGDWAPAAGVMTPRALARRAGWHLSIAVVLFAVVQLVLVGIAIDRGASPALTLGALAVLVGGMIPLARWMLHRWRPDAQSVACRTLVRRYRRDMGVVWLAVLVVPVVWVVLAAGATGAVW